MTSFLLQINMDGELPEGFTGLDLANGINDGLPDDWFSKTAGDPYRIESFTCRDADIQALLAAVQQVDAELDGQYGCDSSDGTLSYTISDKAAVDLYHALRRWVPPPPTDEPPVDDSVSCRKCGATITDAEHDDSDGLCGDCQEGT